MRRFRPRIAVTITAALLALWGLPAVAHAAGRFSLTATNTGPTYAPTFTGNGTLGVRVPADGQGYAGGTVPAQSELAGFYAQPPADVQKRANIPTWSTLKFSDGGQTFSLSTGHTTGWSQTLDLRTGIVTTRARWTASDGHVTDIAYQVLTDRARANIGLVRLTVTPQWSGPATVSDIIDGTPADMTTQVSKGWNAAADRDWVTVQTQGTGIRAAIASQLAASPAVTGTPTPLDASTDQSVGQALTFTVAAGHTYTFTKYVGVVSDPTSDPTQAAQAQASTAAATGFTKLVAGNDAAWAALWKGRIDVLGNPTLASDVNASEFYLWSSTGPGVDWSISPAGLSSNGYAGHIFWDAETWMYPSLLAQHPDLALGIDNYRFDRLGAAEQHAAATGYQGARFPWESALDGTEQIPPPVSVNSEGLYEQHITSDIALAQWQYYLATGDRTWLEQRGWPVLMRTAEFWASRVTRNPDGTYHINHVTGPDEENPNVNDEAYTNVAARATLLDATQAAHVLGVTPPPSWAQIAAGIVVPVDAALQIHPEFAGYQGQLVKQADVTLLQYPWQYPMTRSLATNDVAFYVPRSDPGGPSMSDAVNMIDTAGLGTAGCAAYVYTVRSYEPFIRDVFDQFSETRTGGAFTFMTGIGGFLQEFLYGYSGLRWNPEMPRIAPTLNEQIGGIVLHDLRYRGRTFTIEIGPRTTTVTLTAGAAFTVLTRTGRQRLAPGQPLTLSTRRPDTTPTHDVLRCAPASASSSAPGAPALAAVDGSAATDWQPATQPATLTVPVRSGPAGVRTATLIWGQQWPPAPGPNIPPPPGPVKVLRASSYTLEVSSNGTSWQTVGTVTGRTSGTRDVLHFPATAARFVRLRITASTNGQPAMLDELTLTG